jgi:N-acetylmuramoyl-L-alanine amidase
MPTLIEKLVWLYSKEQIQHPRLKVVTLAQWLLESNRGKSDLAKIHYNFGGLKWRPEMRGYASRVSYTAHDGEDYYCHFASLELFISGYWRFIDRSPYSGWEEHTATGEDFIRFIGPIYTPSLEYSDKVIRLMPEAEQMLEAAENITDLFLSDLSSDTSRRVLSKTGTVVIGPGHGGTERVGGSSPNNAISYSGIKEKKMALELAFLIADRLKELGEPNDFNINVHLTRASDINIGIRDWAALAARTNADLFFCIHFNGNDPQASRKARGTETYYRAVENGNQLISMLTNGSPRKFKRR